MLRFLFCRINRAGDEQIPRSASYFFSKTKLTEIIRAVRTTTLSLERLQTNPKAKLLNQGKQFMNKSELVDAVVKSLGASSRAEAERAVSAVIDGIKTGIRKDKSVQLVGFGTFRVAERAARMGINL